MLVPQLFGSWGAAGYALRRSPLVNLVSAEGSNLRILLVPNQALYQTELRGECWWPVATVLAAMATQVGKTPLG